MAKADLTSSLGSAPFALSNIGSQLQNAIKGPMNAMVPSQAMQGYGSPESPQRLSQPMMNAFGPQAPQINPNLMSMRYRTF